MKKIAFFLLALALLAASGCGTAAQSQPAGSAAPSGAAASPSAEAEAGVLSSFTSEDLEGNEASESLFADYELTMVNIWATFCGPCLNEMPELGQLAEDYAGKGVRVVGIVADVLERDGSYSQSQVELARQLVEETGAAYTHLLPSPDLVDAKLQYVSAVPETIFVDSRGVQVGESCVGSRSGEAWAAIIEELLAEVQG